MTDQRGMTLLEILFVITIVAVLTSIIVPAYTDFAERSRVEATATIVQEARTKVSAFAAENRGFPAAIDPAWFAAPLKNAWYDQHANTIWLSNNDSILYPPNKQLNKAGVHAFWYNCKNGEFHALVPGQESDPATIALFNQVNSTSITSLSQTN